jgi:cytochrome c
MIGLAAVLLFLTVPLIFLSNVNLMLFPDQWAAVTGFFTSLQIGNVFPRYSHFLSASLAVTGLFLAGWFGRKKYPVGENLPDFTHAELRRLFYRVAFYITLAQLLFGPLLLFTLPGVGYSVELFVLILSGAAIALFLLHLLYKEIRADDKKIGRFYIPIIGVFTIIVLLMGTGRHAYRETSLAEHKEMIADASATFRSVHYATQMRLDAGLSAGEALETGPTGKSVFKNCAACHAVDKVLAGPALTEVYDLYKDNPDGIVAWAKNPGRKRDEFAPMPAFAHLGDEKLNLVADYILELVSDK